MTRKNTVAPTKMSISATPSWPPTCGVCGWTGEPTAEQTPYAGCNGDQARHIRPPVGAQS